MSFGNKLQNLRKTANLNQEELAQRLNVSQKTISSWETDRTSPSIGEIDKLCQIFNVNMGYFSEIETRCNKPVFAYPQDYDEPEVKDFLVEVNGEKQINLASVVEDVEKLTREDKEVLAKMLVYMLKVGD